MQAIEQPLAELFSKLPVFPQNTKESIRKILPWVLVVLGVLGVFGALVLLGLSTVALGVSSFSGAIPSYLGTFGTHLLMPVMAILTLLGGIFMIQGKKLGWDFALYAYLLSAVFAVLTFSIFGLLWDFLMVWCLFQIREYFTQDSGSSLM